MYIKLSSFLVVGMKKSGVSITKLLLNEGAEVYVFDEKQTPLVKENILEVEKLGAKTNFDINNILDEIDVVVLSPGVPVDNSIPIKARELGKRIVGELELASYFINNPLIAITGTNGKTTTASMISHVLDSANIKNKLAGNIGTPLSSLVNSFTKDDVGVIEVSSFQLETVARFTPHIACVLNVTQDHLDRHYNMANYIYLKTKLVMNLRESEYAVLNYDDNEVKKMASVTRGKVMWFSLTEKVNGAYLNEDNLYCADELICSVSDLFIEGLHNVSNALASICVLKLLGVSNEDIKKGLLSFKGVKHRIQEVKNLNGITFYNDSKSTNPDSCIKAIESMSANTILILGGYDKGFDYENLFAYIKSQEKIKKVVLTGNSSNSMFKSAIKEGINDISVIKEFDLAIKIAYSLAESGWNILFSPATSSFDLFGGYEERGEKFIEVVNSLT